MNNNLSSYHVVAYCEGVSVPIVIESFMALEEQAIKVATECEGVNATEWKIKTFVCKNLPITGSYLVRLPNRLYEYAIV